MRSIVLSLLFVLCATSLTLPQPNLFSYEYRRGIPAEDIVSLLTRQRDRLFSLVQFSTSPDPREKGKFLFYSTWEKIPSAAQSFNPKMTLREYEAFVNKQPDGFFPVDESVVMIGGSPYFSALWMNDSTEKFKHSVKLSYDELRRLIDEYGKQKFLVDDINGYVVDANIYYLVTWKPLEYEKQLVFFGIPYPLLMESIANRPKGMAVGKLDSFDYFGETRYCVVMVNEPETEQFFAISLEKDRFERVFDAKTDQGFTATNISSDIKDGVARYSAIFNK